jgi:hypothetical protein
VNKVYYINELGYPDGYHKFDNHRLPQAYIDNLNWYSLSYETFSSQIVEENNILIFQSPTNNEFKKLESIIPFLKTNSIFITQESNIFDWFDWTAQEQELYIKILSECKAFLYHSEYDKQVMKAFCSNFIKYPGCTNLSLQDSKLYTQGSYILIPGPIKRYQRGMITHRLVSDTVREIPIYSMDYNPPKNYPLSFPDAYKLDNINLLSRQDKNSWLGLIYNSKFGIDIHREFSGGNVSLEFGSLATPLIGNIHLDTQRDIFPDLSFEFTDYENIKNAIKLLINDKDFYEEMSKKALINTKEKYNSELITSNFNKELTQLL